MDNKYIYSKKYKKTLVDKKRIRKVENIRNIQNKKAIEQNDQMLLNKVDKLEVQKRKNRKKKEITRQIKQENMEYLNKYSLGNKNDTNSKSAKFNGANLLWKKILKNIFSKYIIYTLIVILILAIVITKGVLNKENKSILEFLGIKVSEKNVKTLNISIVEDVDLENVNSKNVIYTELEEYTLAKLLKINTDYSIDYIILSNIEKISNTEYILNISNDYNITSSDIIDSLEKYMKENSKYYSNVKNIKEFEEINEKSFKIILNYEDPMFVYLLDLPIKTDNVAYTKEKNGKYVSKEYIPNEINLNVFQSDEEAVKSYKEENTNIIVTNNFNIQELLGEEEYNIYSYKSGSSLFLFGNINSKVFLKDEIRKAIAYSIDRDRIKKEVFFNNGQLIDVPYIYSDAKYSYDIYAAQNLLLSSGYVMQDNVFTNGIVSCELVLLVNKEDLVKLKVAKYIQEDLGKVGISIRIKAVNEKDIASYINTGNYDLVLANVSLNNNPDISFIKDYVCLDDNISSKIADIENSESIEKLQIDVKNLKELIFSQIACIGIHADNTYVISNKNIVLDNISYKNIFFDYIFVSIFLENVLKFSKH